MRRKHRGPPGFQRCLVNIEFIRVDRPLHHHFTQAITACDEYNILKSTFSIQRKGHSGTAYIRTHHLLYTGRKRDFLVIETLMFPVGNGAIVEQGREDLPDSFLDISRPETFRKVSC